MSLALLEQEERAVSRRRAKLLDRIDFLRAGGAHTEATRQQLERLESEEREVSTLRRDLHARIDAIRSAR